MNGKGFGSDWATAAGPGVELVKIVKIYNQGEMNTTHDSQVCFLRKLSEVRFLQCILPLKGKDLTSHLMIFAQTSTQSVGLAFGLCIAAGASTCLGAAISGFAHVNNNLFLAAAMAMSAGVMT